MDAKDEVIVLTNEGYVTIRGKKGKQDITAFLRDSDGDIDFEIYPQGKAPPSGTDEEVLDLHVTAAETIALDGGTWDTETPGDVLGFEEEVARVTGRWIQFVVPEVPALRRE